MPTGSGNGPASTDHSAPDNRLLIEILSWDWALHVGMAPDGVPQEHRHQGGLLYGRGLDIVGQIVAPERRHGQSVRVWIAPCSPDLAFGPGGLGDVGQCREGNPGRGSALEVSLMLPQDALPAAITCLSTVWKYLHLWTTDTPAGQARITDFAFSGTLPEILPT